VRPLLGGGVRVEASAPQAFDFDLKLLGEGVELPREDHRSRSPDPEDDRQPEKGSGNDDEDGRAGGFSGGGEEAEGERGVHRTLQVGTSELCVDRTCEVKRNSCDQRTFISALLPGCGAGAPDDYLRHFDDLLPLPLLGMIPNRPDTLWIGRFAHEKVGRFAAIGFGHGL